MAEGGDRAKNLEKAEKKGRGWLADHNADVLIWGKVAAGDRCLRLRFLARDIPADGQARSYALNQDTFDLPEDFGTDLSGVLLSVALLSVKPATEQAGQYLVEILKPAALKIERLLENPPQGLGADALAQIQHSYGIVAFVIGEQSGDEAWLDRAIAAYRAALEVLTRAPYLFIRFSIR